MHELGREEVVFQGLFRSLLSIRKVLHEGFLVIIGQLFKQLLYCIRLYNPVEPRGGGEGSSPGLP